MKLCDDEFTITKADDSRVIFSFNGVISKPVKIVHESGWAWKCQKTQIKTCKSIDTFIAEMINPEWICFARKIAKFYCVGGNENA